MMISRRALVLTALGAVLAAPLLLIEDRATAGEPLMPRTDLDPARMTDAEWKAILTPEEYRILREKGTERAFSGEYWNEHTDGTYACAGCGSELFSSDAKFKSGSGWPSFYEPIAEGRVATHVDRSLFMERIEITCAKCGGHLGHVFPDGPAPTGDRFCVNSASLDLVPVASSESVPDQHGADR